MPSQGTQCTHFPLVHPSASVLLPELSCFWQLVSITRSSCAGRSYFPDSMKLLFLAEEKQLLSRETKLARLGSAVLWLLFLRCFHALWWLSHAGSHGKRSQFHTVKGSTTFCSFLHFHYIQQQTQQPDYLCAGGGCMLQTLVFGQD